ncbi:MAG TPA: preprotein translocase subunit SecG [Candidatus Polarisedimenticolaceae bacterium]
MLYGLLIVVHVACCLLLIGVVLLQTGKRADLAGAFGGGGSQTAFGARGAATLLSKMTTIGAIVFMLTSFALSMMASSGASGTGSVLDQVPATSVPAPTAPAPSAPAPPAPPAPSTPTPQGN